MEWISLGESGKESKIDIWADVSLVRFVGFGVFVQVRVLKSTQEYTVPLQFPIKTR